jgi:tetratricopeptide (TPR) repeat protein
MKRAFLIPLLLVLSLSSLPGQQSPQPLTNDSIVKLVKAGLSEDMIINLVDTQPGKYSLAADDIIALKKAGVSEKVVTAMLKKSATTSPQANVARARAAGPKEQGGGEKAVKTKVEAREPIRARGYKDEDDMYRASREDDGEAQYQLDAINQDLIVLVPMCKTADSAMRAEIDKSLRLDEYQLSTLMGRDEAKAFRNRVEEEGCLGGVEAYQPHAGDTTQADSGVAKEGFSALREAFDQGQTLFAAKQYSEAAAQFEQALPFAKDKNVPIVLARLADSYSQASKTDTDLSLRDTHRQKALDYYAKALQADPSNAGLHNNLGSLYTDMGKIPEAQAEFQKAAELDPSRTGMYFYNMGVILVNKGKMDEAAAALKKCTELDGKNANAFYWYGMALLGKAEYKPDGTIVPVPGTVEAFQTCLKLDPDGEWAAAARLMLENLHEHASTDHKARKKKG